MFRFPIVWLTALFASLGCQSEEPKTPARVGPDAGFRVIMVTDMAGLGDKGFNDAGWSGVQRAVAELGIRADMLQSREQADYVSNLSLAAQQADAVVAMGFLMIDAVKRVAAIAGSASPRGRRGFPRCGTRGRRSRTGRWRWWNGRRP